MKNLKFTLLLFCFLSIKAFGQRYFFKQEYQPNSEYEIVMDLVGNTDMKVIAPKLGEQTMKMEQDMKMSMKIITQKLEENKIPFSMKYSNFEMKMKMNGKEMNSKENPLSSMETTGVIENGNKISIIDIKGKAVSEEIKEMIKNQNTQISQFAVDFPKEGMQVGDTFIQKIPYHMKSPQGIDMVMEMRMYYKLIKVEGENADFDTILEMDMKIGNDKMEIIGKAEGQGKSVFNTKINQFSKMDSDMQMRMIMDMGEIGKMTTLSDMKTTTQTKKLK